MSTDTIAEAGQATTPTAGTPQSSEAGRGPHVTGPANHDGGGVSGTTGGGGAPATDLRQTTAITADSEVTSDEADEQTESREILAGVELARMRKFEAISAFGRAALKREATQGEVVAKAEKGAKLTTSEAALFMFEQIDRGEFYANGTKLTLNKEGRYTDPDGKLVDYILIDSKTGKSEGNPLEMPRLTDPVGVNDEVEVLKDGEAVISKIIGMNKKGEYLCQFEYSLRGGAVMEHNPDGSKKILTRALPKDLVRGLQIKAEMDAYQAVAPDNEAYQAYVKALSVPYDDFKPDGEFDQVLEKAVETGGLPTSQAIRAIIEEKFGNDTLPSDVASLIDKFDKGGVIVLSQEQFTEAMSTLGVNSQLFDAEIQHLQTELGHLGQDPKNADRVAGINRQVALLGKIQEAWLDAEAKGGRDAPLANCYHEMMNGKLNFITLAKAVVEGTQNPQKLVDFFKANPNLLGIQNLSEDEQKTLAGLLSKDRTGLLWILIAVVGGALAVVGGVGYGSMKSVEAFSGGGRR